MIDGSQNESKPRIVIIRGDWLCKRDTCYYEPLVDSYDLVGVSVKRTTHDLSLIKFPVVSPWSLDSIIAAIPFASSVLYKLTGLHPENLMYFLGLEKLCRGAAIIDFAETFHPFCLQAVRIKQKYGVRLVCRVHENIPFAHENLRFRRRVKKLVFECADAFITCANPSKAALELEGAPADKIHVIPVGVDTDLYRPGEKPTDLMQELGFTDRDYVVTFVGRMVWEKGVIDFLNAVASLVSSAPNLKCVMVGSGPMLASLPHLLAQRRITDRVRIVGSVPYAKMPDFYRLSDLVVVPSIATPRWQEQFGAVLLEAMACGKPLVASCCGAIPEVVGDGGVIVHQANYVELAQAIFRFYSNPDLGANVGRIGRQKAVSKFSNRVVAAQIDEVYRNVLAGNTSGVSK